MKAITDTGSLKERLISKHAPNYEQSLGWEVSQKDYNRLTEIMRSFMPLIYKRILKLSIQEK